MPEQTQIPSRGMTIYLLKEGEGSQENYLSHYDRLAKHEISGIGNLYVQYSIPRQPRWAGFFEGLVDAGDLGSVSSSAAVLLVEANGRLFAITFGHGRHLLASEKWEERFGLRVALNSLGENSVRSIDKRTFDAISRHSREQASQEASANDFGFDIEQDLLRAVTGTPSDTTLGRRLYGMDALHATVQIEIDSLRELLGRYCEKYVAETYKRNFPWVDQIAEIKSKELIAELDQLLIERIIANRQEKIWIAVPNVVAWENIEGFSFGINARHLVMNDINLDYFRESIRNINDLTRRSLSTCKVHCINTDGIVIERWPLYNCCYAEIEKDGLCFLLSGGKWYKLAVDFVQNVNEFYSGIPRYEIALPEYSHRTENEYNISVANSDRINYALMDRIMISVGGGYNRVEFCDLYTNAKDIIHVKRYGGSSVLSHLFSQGLVSGELLHTDESFRCKVNEQLPPTHRMEDCTAMPNAGEYRIVFAIVSDVDGDLVLPFFSMVSLKHALRRIMGFGFRTALAKIAMDRSYSRRRRELSSV